MLRVVDATDNTEQGRYPSALADLLDWQIVAASKIDGMHVG
jgi:hypothetical protein